EGAKLRQVMIKNEATFNKNKENVRTAKYLLRRISIARKAFEKQINILQSIGRQLKHEEGTPVDYDIKNKRIKDSGSLGDF
ncbi:unnamed protein product, partial [marine sediment metagenome]